MQWVIATHDPNVILGDFNEDFFKAGVVSNFLTQFKFTQIVTQPTHIRGSLLDHIYLKDDLKNSHLFSTLVKAAHYSDHDPVFVLKH